MAFIIHLMLTVFLAFAHQKSEVRREYRGGLAPHECCK